MADKNWQAGGKNLIPARAVVCLLAIVAPFGAAFAVSDKFTPTSYVGSVDPNLIWEMLIGGIVICSFLAAIGLWVLSALRKVRRSQLRRNAFVSSALNNLNQGVVITDAQSRIVFCNSRYLEIYGLMRSDVPGNMTGRELLEMRRKRVVLDVSVEDFYARARTPEGLITELPTGDQFWSNILSCQTADRWRRIRIAASSASFRGNWHRPSNSWNRCSTMFRYAWPPRASRTAATFLPTGRSNAFRVSPATTFRQTGR